MLNCLNVLYLGTEKVHCLGESAGMKIGIQCDVLYLGMEGVHNCLGECAGVRIGIQRDMNQICLQTC